MSNISRKDQLRALCGVVACKFSFVPSMSGGVSGTTARQMMTWIVQRVAAVRAAATLEGALQAERLCWDGPLRSVAIESSVRKVICLGCGDWVLIDRDEVLMKWTLQLTPWSLLSPTHSPPPTQPLLSPACACRSSPKFIQTTALALVPLLSSSA